MKKLIIASLLTICSTAALADSVIVTETQSWKNVPIVVDPTKNVYTVEGTVPVEGDYYYSYSGYRCFKEKRDIAGVNVVTYRSSVAGGVDIYYYPES